MKNHTILLTNVYIEQQPDADGDGIATLDKLEEVLQANKSREGIVAGDMNGRNIEFIDTVTDSHGRIVHQLFTTNGHFLINTGNEPKFERMNNGQYGSSIIWTSPSPQL